MWGSTMIDVFISYSAKDRTKVELLAQALERAGAKVWWDVQMQAGTQFTRELLERLDASKCVVVVWSDNSVSSHWVMEEATYAREKHKLIPIRLDQFDVDKIPFGFRTIHAPLFESRDKIFEAVKGFGVELGDPERETAAVSGGMSTAAGSGMTSSVPGLENVPLAEIQRRAEAGDGAALAEIGNRLSSGSEMPFDRVKSVEYFRRAAAKGHAGGVLGLAVAHMLGHGGVQKSESRARELMQQAAATGYGPAVAVEAMLIHQGMLGYAADPVKGLATLRRLAREKLVDAYETLAAMLLERVTNTRDAAESAEAVEMAKAAIAHGRPWAYTLLGLCYNLGVGVEKDEAKSVELFRQGAEKNDDWGLYFAGLHLVFTDGPNRDPIEGVALLQRAARKGYNEAQFKLAELCLAGTIVKEDVKQGVNWLKQAAESGHAKAKLGLGILTMAGNPEIAQDERTGFALIKEAADSGLGEALGFLAACYRHGRGTAVDKVQAVEYMRRAAEAGDDDAQNSLGYMYLVGEGVTADGKMAASWFERAGDRNVTAAANIASMYAFGHDLPQSNDKAEYWYRVAESKLDFKDKLEQLRQALARGEAGKEQADAISIDILKQSSGVQYVNSTEDAQKLESGVLYALQFWWMRSGQGSLGGRPWVMWTGTYSGKPSFFANPYLQDRLAGLGIGMNE